MNKGGGMRRLSFFTLIIFLSVIACGKTEVKKVPEESTMAKEAISVIDEIKDAYVKRDIRTIEKNSTKNGFRTITNLMKKFDYAELTFTPVLVEIIENEKISINIAWKGLWKIEGKTIEEKGMAVFVLQGRPFKVDDVLRANPFAYPQ
jgi:hypothetical protein